jgi:hypothetical protein
MWGALSDERRGLSFTITVGPRQRSHSRVRVPYCLRFVLSFRIHESTAFYNFHAAGIEVTMSYSSFVLLCCHGNTFVNIRYCGNKNLHSRCLATDVCSGSIIPAFSRHVTISMTVPCDGPTLCELNEDEWGMGI